MVCAWKPEREVWRLLAIRSLSLSLYLSQVQQPLLRKSALYCPLPLLSSGPHPGLPTRSPSHTKNSQLTKPALGSSHSTLKIQRLTILPSANKGEFTPLSIYKLLIHSLQAQILLRWGAWGKRLNFFWFHVAQSQALNVIIPSLSEVFLLSAITSSLGTILPMTIQSRTQSHSHVTVRTWDRGRARQVHSG